MHWDQTWVCKTAGEREVHCVGGGMREKGCSRKSKSEQQRCVFQKSGFNQKYSKIMSIFLF